MMRELVCSEVQEMLPAYSDEPRRDLSVRRHLLTCARCRTEAARYEQMRNGLNELSTLTAEPPADLLFALLSIPDPDNAVVAVKTHLSRNRKAYLSGAAVIVAGAAGTALWRSRRRFATA